MVGVRSESESYEEEIVWAWWWLCPSQSHVAVWRESEKRRIISPEDGRRGLFEGVLAL